MSRSAQTSAGPFTTNFSAIFEAALLEYKNGTEKDLQTHSLALTLQRKNSPDDILQILQNQADHFNAFRESNKLMTFLKSIIDVLFTLSGTISEALGLVKFSPAKAIFAGIGLLLGVSLLIPLLCVDVTFNPGCEGRDREPRKAC
jgi:hypothetical protein